MSDNLLSKFKKIFHSESSKTPDSDLMKFNDAELSLEASYHIKSAMLAKAKRKLLEETPPEFIPELLSQTVSSAAAETPQGTIPPKNIRDELFAKVHSRITLDRSKRRVIQKNIIPNVPEENSTGEVSEESFK